VTTSDLSLGEPVDSVRRLVVAMTTRLHSESEAKWIVASAAGIPPGRLLAVLDAPVSPATVESASAMARRRAAGEPLQYVLGSWSFRRLEVTVDPRALVPRPETEQVVEVALEELRRVTRLVPSPADPLVAVDLGTGSGVIALSLAREGGASPVDVEVWATDLSPPALELAQVNIAGLAQSQPAAAARVRLAEGSWFDALPRRLMGRVHLVVSNPPYVSSAEWSSLDPQIRDHEPRPALVSGDTGLEALEVLVGRAPRWLSPGGSLVLELAPHQAPSVTAMARSQGYVNVRVRPDLAGRARTLVASWPGA